MAGLGYGSSTVPSLLALVLIVASACVVATPPTASNTPALPTSATASFEAIPSATPSISPSAITSPLPRQRPPAHLARTAVREHDGVRVRVTLDRNPLPAGQATWAVTEVTNIGKDNMIWFHGGCATSISVSGLVKGAAWNEGASQTGKAAKFKASVLEYSAADADGVSVQFLQEGFVGLGRYACADTGFVVPVKPGGVIRQRVQWNGWACRTLGKPPSGPVDLIATFAHYWRASTGEPSDIGKQTIKLRIPAWIVDGEEAGLLDPGEIVDAALAAPAFASFIEKAGLSQADAVLQYDPYRKLWWVGLVTYGSGAFNGGFVDPRGADVRVVFQEQWDRRFGNP
jgi:hypothetical protein